MEIITALSTTLRPEQNGPYFFGYFFVKCIYLRWNVSVLNEILLKSVPKGLANNKYSLVRQLLSETEATSHTWAYISLVLWRYMMSLCLDDLMQLPGVDYALAWTKTMLINARKLPINMKVTQKV